MSTPEPPSGPPAEAGEPGHRARNLAASLLGELTGQRKSGLTFAPLEATGLSVERRDSAPAEQSPPDADAPAPSGTPTVAPSSGSTPGLAPAAVPPVAGRPQPETPARLTAVPSPAAETPPEAARPEPERPPVPPSAPQQPAPVEAAVPVPTETPRTQDDDDAQAGEDDPLDRLAATATAPAPARETPPASAPQAPSRPAQERPAATPTVPASTPAAASLATQQPTPSTDVRPTREGGGSGALDVRPAPFAYLAVAQHHTNPARATANGALDQAGQRISSRVDRALVRRAAQVTMEAASLLDACDVLDGRARAADATWTGEHHSPTEVREFEGAWGAFYDAQNALAQHVTS